MKPKKPKPSVKAKKQPVPPIKPAPIKGSPVLSSAYDCLNTGANLTYYLLEVGVKDPKPFVFALPPRAVSWKKNFNLQEYKTQGNLAQPIYFSLAENRRLSLSGITFDPDKGSLPHERLELLQELQKPAGTKLRVYQLLLGNKQAKQFAARSYGKFVISSIDIAEQLRDNTGKTLRAIVNVELIEVSSLQLDFGRDLSVPTTIVPTLPPELANSQAADVNNNAGNVTPSPGNAIKAGTTIAYVGHAGVGAGKSSSHLHMEYIAPGKTLDQTVEGLYATGQLPRFVQDAVSLGPHQGVAKKKLSELKSYSPIQRFRAFKGRPHRGSDYQLTPLANVAMFRCPIVIEVDMFFKDFRAVPTKDASTLLTILDMECTVKGYEGIYRFLHVDGLAPEVNTSAKRITSTQPNNTGGKTTKALQKQGLDTVQFDFD